MPNNKENNPILVHKCAVCNDTLEVRVIEGTFLVDPCTVCNADAYGSGKEEVYSDGHEEGIFEGENLEGSGGHH